MKEIQLMYKILIEYNKEQHKWYTSYGMLGKQIVIVRGKDDLLILPLATLRRKYA